MMTSSNGNIFCVTGPLCGEITGPGDFPTQRPVTRSFDVSLICVWINGWVNNREAGDLRRYRGHYDVIVMGIFCLSHVSMTWNRFPYYWLFMKKIHQWIHPQSVNSGIVLRNPYLLSWTKENHNPWYWKPRVIMMTSSNRNIFRVTGPLWGEFTGHRWIPLKSLWLEALMLLLICAWIHSLVSNREAGDLRPHRAHYDVIVMVTITTFSSPALPFHETCRFSVNGNDNNDVPMLDKLVKLTRQFWTFTVTSHTWRQSWHYNEFRFQWIRVQWKLRYDQ